MVAHPRLPALALAGAALALPVALLPLIARPELGLGAIVVAAGLALAWVSPAIGLGLEGIRTPLVALGVMPVPSSVLSAGIFAWIAAGVAFAVFRARGRPRLPMLLETPVLLSVLLCALLMLRLTGSPAVDYGEQKLEFFVTLNLVFLVAGVVVARRARDLDLFLLLSALVAALAAATLVVELAQGLQPVFTGRYALAGVDDPIELGRQSGTGLLIALYALLFRGGRARLLALALLPFLAVALLASGSRGPLLGLLVGAAVLVVGRARISGGRRRLGFAFLALAVMGAISGRAAPGQSIDRALALVVGGEEGLSSNGRNELWSQGWSLFLEHPLLGVGTGGYAASAPTALFPHNLFLEAAAELGILGLLLVVGIVVAGAARALRAAPPGAGTLRRSHGVVVGALIAAALTNALFSGDVTTNSGLWLALGLAVGLAGQDARARAATAPPHPGAAAAPGGR
jgi:O-antigen ligase